MSIVRLTAIEERIDKVLITFRFNDEILGYQIVVPAEHETS